MGFQLGGGLHFIHAIAQGILNKAERFLVRLGFVRFLLIVQLQVPIDSAAKRLILVCSEQIRHKFICLVGEIEDLHIVILQNLRLRHMVDGLHTVTGGKVDEFLLLAHAIHILAQRDQFLFRRGIEQQQIL